MNSQKYTTYLVRTGELWCVFVNSLNKLYRKISTGSKQNGIPLFKTLRPRQNGRHFADDIFKCIFLNENVWIPIEISLKFVPKGPITNIPALVQIMAWRRPGDKPLSEPMMVSLATHICVTRPQWVKYAIKDTALKSRVHCTLTIKFISTIGMIKRNMTRRMLTSAWKGPNFSLTKLSTNSISPNVIVRTFRIADHGSVNAGWKYICVLLFNIFPLILLQHTCIKGNDSKTLLWISVPENEFRSLVVVVKLKWYNVSPLHQGPI